MNETWRDVVGYEGLYEVSDLGRVRSVDRIIEIQRGDQSYTQNTQGKILRQTARKHGYLGVWLYGIGGIAGRNGKMVSVHRIVADAFCQKDDGDCEVNHLNEDKTDNRAVNLEWCTHKENSAYGNRGKRIGLANRNGKQSKKVFQYLPSGELVAEYPSMAEVQRSTGFRKGNIWKQMNGIYETAYGYKWGH